MFQKGRGVEALSLPRSPPLHIYSDALYIVWDVSIYQDVCGSTSLFWINECSKPICRLLASRKHNYNKYVSPYRMQVHLLSCTFLYIVFILQPSLFSDAPYIVRCVSTYQDVCVCICARHFNRFEQMNLCQNLPSVSIS